jgi:hypothetical protein
MDPSLQALLARLDRLTDEFRELREGVQKAVRVADLDPEMALTRARKVLEYVIRDVYEQRIKEPPGTRPLENLLQRIVKDGYFPDRLDAYASAVRKLGNVGVHSFGEKVTVADVYQSLAQLIPILEWYFEVERPEALGRPALQVVTALHDLMPSQPAPVEAPIVAGKKPTQAVSLGKTKHKVAALMIGAGFVFVLVCIGVVQQFKKNNAISSPKADLDEKAKRLRPENGKTEAPDKSVGKVSSNVEKVTITDIFSRYADAVLAVVIDEEGDRFGQATAFEVKKQGVLATSGNVAFQAKQALQAGRKVSVHSRGGKKTYAVISATPHRDYKPLYKITDQTPDVGILTISLPAGELLPNVVELATEDELRKLSPGTQVCSIAYRSWSDQTVPSKIEPYFGQGTLTRLATLKGEFGEFSDQYVVQFNMVSSAGASGSPVFNNEGKVVAIFSSIDLKAQVCSGMRVDLLKELLK